MKKLNLLLILFLLFFVVNLFANDLQLKKQNKKYGLVLPTISNGVDETVTIPLTAKEVKELMAKPGEIRNYLTKPTGIIDTLTIPIPAGAPAGGGNPYFGGGPGDSMGVYFNPGAGCKILKVGFNAGHNGDDDTNILCDGVSVSIHKARYDGKSEPGGGGKYKLGDWISGVWTPTDWYAANYENSPVGAQISPFEFPVTIVADPKDQWEEVDYTLLGALPDNMGDAWVVMLAPYGTDAASVVGFCDGQNWSPPAPFRLWKYYVDDAWYVRHQVSFNVFCIVEFYENTPPVLTPGGPYGSVLNSDAVTVECAAVDIDANNEAEAGIVDAKLMYKIDDGTFSSIDMTLATGTITDGNWEGVLPAGFINPGEIVTFYFEMTDGGGLTTTSFESSFAYFAKKENILVFFNNGDGPWFNTSNFSPYYDNLWLDADDDRYTYDMWDGVLDGPLTAELVNMYNNIVQVDAYSPATMNDDVIGAWFASGPKNFFWSSQEWGYSLTGGADSTFAADDWHNMYMGIGTIGPMDINANYTERFPVNAVVGDPISGELADFAADSLQLYIWTVWEVGYNDWCDAMTAGEGAVTCFTDSALGQTMGVHKESSNGTKTVFTAFDPLALDTKALSSYTLTTGEWWTEPNVSSVAACALRWFGIDQTAVNDNFDHGVAIKYNLSQNYPNPFNPETKISYSIEKAGQVKLAIYNVLGQKVADLVNEFKVANSYKVNFDASNLTSGIYFYRLEVGDYSKTMKMMLLQ